MGWLGLAANGESAGTAGFGYRLEGIRIQIVAAGSVAPSWTFDKEDPFYGNPLSKYPSIKTEIGKVITLVNGVITNSLDMI